MQLSLFPHVQAVYAESEVPVSNETLYRRVAKKAGISIAQLNARIPVGTSESMRSPIKREIRWHQQTLKSAGLLQQQSRSQWELTGKGKMKLRKARPGTSLVACSTKLGVALWSLAKDVFSSIDEPITLALTSPPYPLRVARAYGNPCLDEYVDWLVDHIEPIAKNLAPGGSICLNVSNDIFESGSPSRSIYREKLVIAIVERLELHKMDELIWHNPCKPPGPVLWASKSRQQLNVSYEVIYWFCKDPKACVADNRRVLEPHTEAHRSLIDSGGAKAGNFSDGAYRRKSGSFANPTEGKIPRNILQFPHNCTSQSAYKKISRSLGLPVHGAPYPLKLAMFLVRFLSREGDLVVDPFAGSLTTGLAAEMLGRRWLVTECMWEYSRGGAERFRHHPEFVINPDFLGAA